MGAYKRNVVVVIKIGAYIHGMLILCKCLLSRFYGILKILQKVMRPWQCMCKQLGGSSGMLFKEKFFTEGALSSLLRP